MTIMIKSVVSAIFFCIFSASAMAMPLVLADGSTLPKQMSEGKWILVNIWAQWCGPCRAIAPIIEELADEYAGTALVGKVDVDANQELSMQYNIRSIPTILILKNVLERKRKKVYYFPNTIRIMPW